MKIAFRTNDRSFELKTESETMTYLEIRKGHRTFQG